MSRCRWRRASPAAAERHEQGETAVLPRRKVSPRIGNCRPGWCRVGVVLAAGSLATDLSVNIVGC
jgi:hypothetical protein